MKNDIKITIVTITYNLKKAGREQMFRQCVESVHNQTYKNIEHIIIDGASTDGSLSLIKEYKKRGWITYLSEPDTGVYDAMNKGLKLATGDYIAFLNSDDYYHEVQGIRSVVDALLSSKADFCYGACNFVTESGDFYGVSKPVIGSFYAHMPFSHQTLFVNTKLMRKLGGFDSDNFKNAGDYDFIIRLCLSGATSCECPLNFVSYRMGGLSEAKHDEGQAECIKSFIKNYQNFCPDIDPDNLLCGLIVPISLYKKIRALVSKEILCKMDNIWKKRIKIDNSVAKITEIQTVHLDNKNNPKIDATENVVYLLDYIPLLKIRQKYNVKRYLLFSFLPILKTKYVGESKKVYLFACIPLMTQNKMRYINYKPIVCGVYNFAGALSFESDGLQSPEAWGCWSNGDKTEFYLKTDDIYTAIFDVMPFLAKYKEKQVVSLYINNSKKRQYVLDNSMTDNKITFNLPKSNKLRLTFKYEDVKSPADLGLSEDNRKISIGFKTLEIKK